MDHARYADAWSVKLLGFPAVVLAVLATAPSALAVPEQGDAGDTPATAQNLTTQVVPTITGDLEGEDADLYRVCLAGGRSFSASTVGTTETNTQLFLFDGNGRGIYADDDADGSQQSTLPAGDPLTPVAPGEYLLGVSPDDRDPLSADGPDLRQRSLSRGRGRPRRGARRSRAGADSSASDGELRASRSPGREPANRWRPRSRSSARLTALSSLRAVPWWSTTTATTRAGSGLVSCEGNVPDGATLDTSTLGPQTLTVTARDGAGNETTATATVEVVDESAPVIEVRAPSDGAVYSLGERGDRGL